MKNKLMPMIDKLLLRKRALIETVNDQLKNICQIEHTRHRSKINFLVNLLSELPPVIIELGQSISIEDKMSGLFATEPL
jgi:Transposase DDE domain